MVIDGEEFLFIIRQKNKRILVINRRENNKLPSTIANKGIEESASH